MRRVLLGCTLWLLAAIAVAGMQRERAVSLFDGRTLAGWEGDTTTMWRVEDGAIIGGSLSETVPKNDFLATTKRYGNFVLRLQFKLAGTGFVNAGVQFRSERLREPAHEMTGYQADLGEKFWGSLYDESRRNRVLLGPDQTQMAALVKAGDWNDYEIRAEGRRIRLTLNGRQTVDYTEDDPAIPLSGLIALQIHGGGKALVAYRNITIVELP
jgi:Domain of Unknown Function (DUF1080)